MAKTAAKPKAKKKASAKASTKTTKAKKAPAAKAPAKGSTASEKMPPRATRGGSKDVPKIKIKKVSRAVTRLVEPGSQVDCMHCDERVKFQAKMRHQQVICNVYEKNKWLRVEHFHADCYKLAKQPFGKPID